MSLSADGLKNKMQQKMEGLTSESSPDAAQLAMCDAIVEYIKENLDITVPSGSFIETVTGGSGAPALGVANVDEVDCGVE